MNSLANTTDEYKALGASDAPIAHNKEQLRAFIAGKNSRLVEDPIITAFIESCTFKEGRLVGCYYGPLEDRLHPDAFNDVIAACGMSIGLFSGYRDHKCMEHWAGWSCGRKVGWMCEPFSCSIN